MTDEPKMIERVLWMGKLIEEMTHEELVDALRCLVQANKRLHIDAIRYNGPGRVALMKIGLT